ncbi:MAG: thioredoxin domain-containing protein [Deltaproteobacteria bacterium]|nr:thioredoxin domain-containing protein [Deltaproteobacteria bacterium]
MKKQNLVIGAVIAVVLAWVVGDSLVKQERAESLSELVDESATTLVPPGAPMLGAADAPVDLVEFFDPACETCAAFYTPVKKLMAANPGKIRLVLRYLPLHQGSDTMVAILEASRKQGKFQETLEIMFRSQAQWASHHDPRPDRIWEFLAQSGQLDLDRLREDMNDPTIEMVMARDIADAKALGIRKTPGYLVNGKPLPSFGFQQLQALVTSEIAASE